MSSDVAIRVQNLSKVFRIYAKPEDRLVQMATLGRVRRFQEFSAVRNISLEVQRGETVGIIGRNGCGKSTLLQMIVGTLQPTSGSVEVQGRIAALLELGAGFNGEFTGRENVYMNGAILGFSREEMDARFEAIAKFAAIGDFIERPVKTYSSGMFVRLAFAVSTAVEPDILVVDEALSVGDEAFQRKCFARIEAIKERGGTILFVSHGAQTIVQLCDRAVLLDGGEKLLEGEPKRVVAQYQRLVNASDEGAAGIRASIVAMGGFATGSHDIPDLASEPVVDHAQQEEIAIEDDKVDFFVPELQSESRFEQGSGLVTIKNERIVNLHGDQVNQLRLGKNYELKFNAHLHTDLDYLAFNIMIRNTRGVALGGHRTDTRDLFSSTLIKAGDVLSVSFRFLNRCLPGTFFCNIRAIGRREDNQIEILHRIVDALIFCTISDDDILAIAQIDFNMSSYVSKIK